MVPKLDYIPKIFLKSGFRLELDELKEDIVSFRTSNTFTEYKMLRVCKIIYPATIHHEQSKL